MGKPANSDDVALKLVREHERMKTALLAIADACARKQFGSFRLQIGDIAARGLNREPKLPAPTD